MEQVTFKPWWLQSRVSKNVAKRKNAAAGSGSWCVIWTYMNQRRGELLEHGIKSLIFEYWNGFLYDYVESNLCRIEMKNGTVCGIRFACFFQHATSRLLCLFCSFLRTCTDECFFPFFRWIAWGFSVCFASHSHFYPFLGSTVWYWKWIVFLFGCFCFFLRMWRSDVFEWSLKYPEESEESR